MGPLGLSKGPYDLDGSRQQWDATPILLLSTERSGSNLLRSILGTHSEVAAPHPLETAFPWRDMRSPAALSTEQRRTLVRDVLINKYHSHQPLVQEMDARAVHRRVESVEDKSFLTVQEALYAEYAGQEGASHWVSKDPSIWDYVDELREYYDNLNVVYLVRDARDVALSFKTSNVGRYHPYFSARRWQAEQARGIELLESDFGDSMFLVRYEDLLEKSEDVTESLCGFFGIPYEPEMLYYYDTEDAQRASESADVFDNLSVPIKSDNYGKFHDRLPAEEIRILETVTGDELQHFGYELTASEDDREEIDLDPAAYERADKALARSARWQDWRQSPREKLRRHGSRLFSTYMILRYGLLA